VLTVATRTRKKNNCMNESRETRPPRLFGTLIAIMGAAVVVAGINFLIKGDSPYFLVIGVGILAAGVLMALGKRLGVYVYGCSLAVILIWSFIEDRKDMSQFLARVGVPVLLGLYIFSKKLRGRLS